MLVDTRLMRVFIPTAKQEQVLRLLTQLLDPGSPPPSVGLLLSVVGKVNALSHAIPHVHIFCRSLQSLLRKPAGWDWPRFKRSTILLPPAFLEEDGPDLVQAIRANRGRPIRHTSLSVTLTTDAGPYAAAGFVGAPPDPLPTTVPDFCQDVRRQGSPVSSRLSPRLS